MIKIIYSIRRNPDMTEAEFRRYWLEEHGPFARLRGAATGMVRYTQSHPLYDPRVQPIIDARRDRVPPFDGIAEGWFESIEAMLEAGSSRDARVAGRELIADEAKFIDVENSTMMIAEEHVIYDRARRTDVSDVPGPDALGDAA